ncbi:MAG: DUF2617 family protein, partial [Planctomycetota bacterium]
MQLENIESDFKAVQQAADLHLFLVDRPLHPELFRLYADYRVKQSRYHANVWITGLGHVVTVTSGGRSLTEYIGSDNELIPARSVLTRFRMKGERDVERECFEDWKYLACTQVETMDEPLYKSVHDDLIAHAEKHGWLIVYDRWSDGDLAPFSYLEHDARDGEFHVSAFHAFPRECTIVKTQTIIELPPAAH